MKILYGVQGTGNGHITRARAMAKALSDAKARGADIDVQFLVSGRPRFKLFDMEPFGDYWWCEGLTFRSKKGRVVLTETLIKSRPMQLVQDIRELDVSPFDLIITDYEPITAWAGKLAGVKVIGLGHQYAFGQSIPQAKATMIDKRVLQNFAPADVELGLHWHHFGTPILPPIAPVHLTIEISKYLLDSTGLRQLFTIQPNRLGIWDCVFQTEPEKAHERKPVAKLILHLIVRQIVQLAEQNRLEHDNRIPRLAAGTRLTLFGRLAPDALQKRTKTFPWHHRIDRQKWVVLGVKPSVARLDIEKSHLTHLRHPPITVRL